MNTKHKEIVQFAIVCSGLILLLYSPYQDGDIWWHIALGQDIVNTYRIPSYDQWTYTANGNSYIYHSWLGAVFFAVIYNYFGESAIEISKYIFHLSSCLFLYSCIKKKYNSIPAFLLSLLLAFWLHSRSVRPQLFTPLFMLLFFNDLVLNPSYTKNKFILINVFLLLWTNLHGGFVLGLLLIYITSAINIFNCIFFNQNGLALKWNFYILLCSFSVTLINPYGIGVYTAILSGVHNSSFDWFNILVYPYVNISFITITVILVVILFCTWLVQHTYKYPNVENYSWLLVTISIYFVLISARRLEWMLIFPVIGILHYSYKYIHIDFFVNEKSVIYKYVYQFILVISLSIVLYFFKMNTNSIYPQPLPESIVDYIHANNLNGNVFCPLTWSGKVTFASNGGLKTFIDGRLLLHTQSFFNDYLKIFYEDGLRESLIIIYNIDYLLIPAGSYELFLQSSVPIIWQPVFIKDDVFFLKRKT